MLEHIAGFTAWLVGVFEEWHEKWQGNLNERTEEAGTGKTHYKHKPLRSAYLSIRHNLPFLFTWYDHIGSGIPNTTNIINAHFSQLKSRLLCHNGLSRRRKQKFADEFLRYVGLNPMNEKGSPRQERPTHWHISLWLFLFVLGENHKQNDG